MFCEGANTNNEHYFLMKVRTMMVALESKGHIIKWVQFKPCARKSIPLCHFLSHFLLELLGMEPNVFPVKAFSAQLVNGRLVSRARACQGPHLQGVTDVY